MLTDWSLQSLFDRSTERSCPVASSSSVTVVLPEKENYQITPQITAHVDDVAVYDLSSRTSCRHLLDAFELTPCERV